MSWRGNKPTIVVRKGDVVITEHPFAFSTAVVARVAEEPTASMMQLQYLDRHGKFDGEVKRRKRDSVIGIVAAGRDPAAVRDALVEAHRVHSEAVKAAEETLAATTRSLCEKTA